MVTGDRAEDEREVGAGVGGWTEIPPGSIIGIFIIDRRDRYSHLFLFFFFTRPIPSLGSGFFSHVVRGRHPGTPSLIDFNGSVPYESIQIQFTL